MKCPGDEPRVPDLPPNDQTLLCQMVRPGRLAFTQGNQRCQPGAEANPVPGTESGDNRLSLLEPVTDGLESCCINQREPPDRDGRLDKCGSHSEFVACFPIELQRLLEEGQPPGELSTSAEHIRQRVERPGDLPRLVYLAHEPHALRSLRDGLGHFASPHGETNEQAKAVGDAACVPQCLVLGQTQLSEPLRSSKVALLKRQTGTCIQDLDALGDTRALTSREGSLQEGARLTVAATHLPEVPERGAQAQGDVTALRCLCVCYIVQCPFQSRSQVVLFSFQPLKPDSLVRTSEFRLCLLRQLQVVSGMSLPRGLQLSTRGELLQSKLADRLQHHEAGFFTLLSCLLEQILVNEGGHFVHYQWHCAPMYSTDRFCCRKRAATDEDREQTEEPLFICSEQIMTPLDGIAQGLLPGGYITYTADEQRQTLPQTRQERLWWEQPDARRRQFDGQWEPIQAHADFCHERRVGVCHLELRGDRLRPLDEEGHRLVLREGKEIRQVPGIRERQGWHVELAFGSQMQPLPACDQHFQAWAPGEQVCHGQRCADHLLKVIQQHQRLFLLESVFHVLQRRLVSCFAQTEHLADGRDDQVGIADGSQGHEPRPIGE